MVIAEANVRDDKLLAATLDAVVIERPEPTEEAPQHLCLDKGYDNKGSREIARERSYVAHIQRIGEEKLDEAREKRYPARRWVVERALAWLSIVVMDNLGAHRPRRVRELIEERGCELVYLPAYSPDLNPIEEAFSKVKHLLRKIGPRTKEALVEAMG